MSDPPPDVRPRLLVFSDDWGRHPSSCQHLVGQLLPKYRTWWVNTIGTRRPGLDRATLGRGLEKLRQWIRRGPRNEAMPENLTVLNPRMWPYFTRSYDRALNRWLLARHLVPVVESAAGPVVAVTTLPLVAGLMDKLPVARWIYYCVDDFSRWPGVDRVAIEALEERLARRSDVLIAVSRTLQDRLARWGRTSHLLTHGVDLEHWQPAASEEPVPQLDGLERPLVLFWGVIDRRMDTPMVHRLAGDLKRGTVVLVGPESDPDPALCEPNRVVRIKEVPFGQLPRLAQQAAVLVMPYADLPVTRAIQPLKLKEYLATGRPVVVRRLPATEEWAEAADVVDTPEAFSEAVRRRIVEGVPDGQLVAREGLAEESWAAKARRFDRWALHLESPEASPGEDAGDD
ncbi:MAG: glycosyltransferase [Planctomycetes bacterium]|nr:glycosyltransferase [Planctomycetota bacterium]